MAKQPQFPSDDELERRLFILNETLQRFSNTFQFASRDTKAAIARSPDLTWRRHDCHSGCTFRATEQHTGEASLQLCVRSGNLHVCGPWCPYLRESAEKDGVTCTITGMFFSTPDIEARNSFDEEESISRESRKAVKIEDHVRKIRNDELAVLHRSKLEAIGEELLPRDCASTEVRTDAYRGLLMEAIVAAPSRNPLKRKIEEVYASIEASKTNDEKFIQDTVYAARKMNRDHRLGIDTLTRSSSSIGLENGGTASASSTSSSSSSSSSSSTTASASVSGPVSTSASSASLDALSTVEIARRALATKTSSDPAVRLAAHALRRLPPGSKARDVTSRRFAATGPKLAGLKVTQARINDEVLNIRVSQLILLCFPQGNGPGIQLTSESGQHIQRKCIELWDILTQSPNFGSKMTFDTVCMFLFFEFLKAAHGRKRKYSVFHCDPDPYILCHTTTVTRAAELMQQRQGIYTAAFSHIDNVLLGISSTAVPANVSSSSGSVTPVSS